MPYWKVSEQTKATDCEGNQILPGHILEQKELNAGNSPWRYFCCYTADGKTIELRDLNANNVCMCDIGENSDVKIIGHIADVYKQLEASGDWSADSWGYYFSVFTTDDCDTYNLGLRDEKEIERDLKLNNFPYDWKYTPQPPTEGK